MSRGCHNWVQIREPTGDGLRWFALVKPLRESLRHNAIRAMSDWGQVVAGSNPVSPTRETADQRWFRRNRGPPFFIPRGGVDSNADSNRNGCLVQEAELSGQALNRCPRRRSTTAWPWRNTALRPCTVTSGGSPAAADSTNCRSPMTGCPTLRWCWWCWRYRW